jgi:hypothetical protein
MHESIKRKSWELSHVIYLKLTQFLQWCIFQSWVMGSRTYFSVSQHLRPELSAKWILSILRFTSDQKNWEKCFLFNLRNDCLLIWANSQNDHYLHSKWSLVVILWICSALQAVISLSAWLQSCLNSQDFLLRIQNEAPNDISETQRHQHFQNMNKGLYTLTYLINEQPRLLIFELLPPLLVYFYVVKAFFSCSTVNSRFKKDFGSGQKVS